MNWRPRLVPREGADSSIILHSPTDVIRRGRDTRQSVQLRGPHPSLIDPLASNLYEGEHDIEAREQSRPPAHEVVEWHLTYAAEAYLPSHAERLQRGLKEQGWTTASWRPQPNLVHSFRQSAFGGAWAKLGAVFPPGHNYWGNVTEASLPDGVASVQLALRSVTPALTVLLAAFEWDDQHAEVLDRIVKSDRPKISLPMALAGSSSTRSRTRSYS
jgi:hypothetical protein